MAALAKRDQSEQDLIAIHVRLVHLIGI